MFTCTSLSFAATFLQAFAVACMLGCLIAARVDIDFLLRQTLQADVFCLTFKSYSGSLKFASTLGRKGQNRGAGWEENDFREKQL